MQNSVYIVCFLTALIHFIETSAYTLRIAGIKTKKIATALSLITSILLISRLSNMCQAPLLGLLVDNSILSDSTTAIEALTLSFRWIIFSAFLGTLIGAVLIPFSIRFYTCIIFEISKGNNLFIALFNSFKSKLKQDTKASSKISLASLLNLGTLPKNFLFFNIAVTAVYTIGVLCSLLAGAMLPEYRSTAINLSGIVNGIGTLLLATMVDPIGARVTDQVASSERPNLDIYKVVFFLVLGKLVGTLVIAQLLFLPLSHYIKSITVLLTNFL